MFITVMFGGKWGPLSLPMGQGMVPSAASLCPGAGEAVRGKRGRGSGKKLREEAELVPGVSPWRGKPWLGTRKFTCPTPRTPLCYHGDATTDSSSLLTQSVVLQLRVQQAPDAPAAAQTPSSLREAVHGGRVAGAGGMSYAPITDLSGDGWGLRLRDGRTTLLYI